MTNWRKLNKLLVLSIILAVLVGSFGILMPDLVFGQGSQATDYEIYFPIILNNYFPPQPPPPPQTTLYVTNDLGVTMTVEVRNSGVGVKTIPPGRHLYGSFPPGTYTIVANASGYYPFIKVESFSEGIEEYRFY